MMNSGEKVPPLYPYLWDPLVTKKKEMGFRPPSPPASAP